MSAAVLTLLDDFLTMADMQLIRGSSLAGFDALAAAHGGRARELLTAAGVDPAAAGRADRFVPLRSAIAVVEHAAEVLGVDDFGRRLATCQGIDVLGPVGVAARTATTVGEALTILDVHMAAYSPGISVRVVPGADDGVRRFVFDFLLYPAPPQAHAVELSLGVSLRVLQLFLGPAYRPLIVHLPHSPLGSEADYREYFGCPARFVEPIAGFTLHAADLARPLHHDPLAHQVAMSFLIETGDCGGSVADTVRSVVKQLLPTGELSAELVAGHFAIHPKTLQRRLSAEGTTFVEVVDRTRREVAHRLLTTTSVPLARVSRQLGYAEHSVFSRACRRWFGMTPSQYRNAVGSTARALAGRPAR